MPRHNLLVLIAVVVVSLLCYQKVSTNRYGRIVVSAMDQIERRYLEPIEPYELFEGAMEGMVAALDDPNSAFINRKEKEAFNEDLDREFGGVGMEVSLDPKTKQLTVMSPVVGSPAYEAGVLAGDKILRIDGQSTQGMPLRHAVVLMRGKPGDAVTLSILHEGADEPVEITLTRAIVKVDTVRGDTRNADGSWNLFLEGYQEEPSRIGYLRVNTFGKNTNQELRRALDWLVAHGMQGVILDLRDDPGGRLSAATDVCDLFIDSGVIVTTRGRDEQIRATFEATAKNTYSRFPMAVLVNAQSASASEIVAACLQDYGRAVIVGQRTYGKGTVQEVIGLEDQGELKLTTASFWRPSGQNIHKTKQAEQENAWGVSPDKGYEVILEGEELTRLRLWRYRRDMPPAGQPPEDEAAQQEPFVDPQLAKAVEYIKEQLAKEK